MTTLKPIICPSLLSSDFAHLARDANLMLEYGADWLHIDVMDNHFVPNLTLGAPIVKSLRKHCVGHFDCHLMVTNPETLIEDFKNAGANSITFHIEATEERGMTQKVITQIKEAGMMVALCIKPKTPVDVLFPYIDQLDFVLIMTVEPGFGGQSFMKDMMTKVSTLRSKYPSLNIQVDGGLDTSTIDTASQAGANVIVAGSALFKPNINVKDTIQLFKDSINKHSPSW